MLKAASLWVLPEWEGARDLLLIPDKQCSRKSSEGNTPLPPLSQPPTHMLKKQYIATTWSTYTKEIVISPYATNRVSRSSGNAFVRRLVILSVLAQYLSLLLNIKAPVS